VFDKEFHILLVDDEPDVLAVSRLAMRRLTVFGLPLKLHLAASKAGAIDLIEKRFPGTTPGADRLSLALIDVVMETDEAGLELCEYIRAVRNDKVVQIYVRTGQPGLAPERSVVDRFDINGYLHKLEATEDKLYTVLKSGIRQAAFTALALELQENLYDMIFHGRARQWIVEVLNKLGPGERGGETGDLRSCSIVEDRVVAGDWRDADKPALFRRDELLELPAVALGSGGDQCFIDQNDLLIRIAPGKGNAELHYLMRGSAPCPEWEIFLYHRFLRSVALLWRRAA
jgi:CheY-like chemotaxis protein